MFQRPLQSLDVGILPKKGKSHKGAHYLIYVRVGHSPDSKYIREPHYIQKFRDDLVSLDYNLL